jgi:protein-tyrosine phosphatase
VTGERFEILFVCHANLCRSPLAERLARRAFDETFGVLGSVVETSSAGTHAYEGSMMHRGSATVLAQSGINPNGFASRSLTSSVLATADLVLTAEREHRAACVSLTPAKAGQVFTLRQFTRMVTDVPPPSGLAEMTVPDRLRALVEQVNANRHVVPAVSREDDDLPDPVGRPLEAFEICAEEIRDSLAAITRVIAVA